MYINDIYVLYESDDTALDEPEADDTAIPVCASAYSFVFNRVKTSYNCLFYSYYLTFMSTPLCRPNKADLNVCPSVLSYVCPQAVFSHLNKICFVGRGR